MGKAADDFEDVHMVQTYIANRLAALASDQPLGEERLVLGAPERTAVLQFVKARRGEVGELRTRTYLAWLPVVASRLGPRFLTPDRATPQTFREAFSSYARSTKETIAACLQRFWRWKFEQEEAEVPHWLRIKLEAWKPTNGASDMLTVAEVAKIAEGAHNFRDRAWIWTLFNSGCRPGEVYRLRIGDVVLHDEGFIELRVPREKGSAPEPAPVYEDAVPALLAWLNDHPARGDPMAPLWVELGGGAPARVATYPAMCKALRSAVRRAGVIKRVTPYMLRRSRLTLLAKDPEVSTSILERIAGWVPGSRVAQHYIHLSGKDVINAMNTKYGIATDGEGSHEKPRTPLRCGRCKTVNPSGSAYCTTCGGPLSLPAVKSIETARAAQLQLAELLREPKAIELLAQLYAQMKASPATADSAATPAHAPTPSKPPRHYSPGGRPA